MQEKKQKGMKGVGAHLEKWSARLRSLASATPPLLVFVFPFLLTVALTIGSWIFETYRHHVEFQAMAQDVAKAFQRRMDVYIQGLLATRGFFLASEDVTRDEFRRYVEALELKRNFPGIQGIGWVLRLKRDQVPKIEKQLQSEGFTDARVRPATPREDYLPILFLEPLDWRNRRAIGYDMFTEDVRREAMSRARDTGSPATSGPVTLVQETEQEPQSGFLVYIPWYKKDAILDTVRDRQDALLGYVYAPFRTNDLMNSILAEVPRDSRLLNLELVVAPETESGPSHTIYSSLSERTTQIRTPTPLWNEVLMIQVPGNKWQLIVQSTPELEAQRSYAFPLTVFLTGLLVTVLIYSLVRSLHSSDIRSRQGKRVLELVNSIGLSLRGETDLNHLTAQATRLASEVVQAEIGTFCIGDGELTLRAAWGASIDQLRDFPFGSLGQLLGDEALRSFSDLSRDSGPVADFLASGTHGLHCDMRSAIVARIRSTGGVYIGLIALFRSGIDAFPERAENLLTGIAAQAGVALDNASLVETIKKSEARYRSIAEENSRLLGEANILNRTKDEFLATLSHELRTPLNVILGHAELIKSEPTGNPDLDESIDAIYRNARAQTQIVSDLLDISAIITGKVALNPESLSLDELTQSTVEAVRFSAENKKINLQLDLNCPNKRVFADPTRIRQVLWNLLSNAIKFTPSNGDITVSTEIQEAEILVKVRDSGRGIDPDFLPYVFERFRQEDASMTRKHGGLGLGLSIVRNLLELHGGHITAHSNGIGKGSEFIFSLPLFEGQTQPTINRDLNPSIDQGATRSEASAPTQV